MYVEIAIVFVLLVLGYIAYTMIGPSITPIPVINQMQKEVFLVKLTGYNLLGLGQLQPGFSYANAIDINLALTAGMKVPGVNPGDYILYSFETDIDTTRSPHVYAANSGDFMQGFIQFQPLSNPSYGSVTFWACIYGYKPSPEYTDPTFVFQSNQNISSYVGVSPYAPGEWFAPQTASAVSNNGNECFIINFSSLQPYTLSPAYFNSRLNATVATLDQILYSRSRGFLYGTTQSFCYDNTVMSQLYLTVPPISFVNCNYNQNICQDNNLVVWGNKKNINISNFSATVLPFNTSKSSFFS